MKTLKLEQTDLEKPQNGMIPVQLTREEIQVIQDLRRKEDRLDKPLPDPEDPPKMTFVDLIRLCLDNQPRSGQQSEGFSYRELRNRGRIEDALEKLEKGKEKEFPLVLKLEDQDAQNLVQYMKEMRWGSRHPAIRKFCAAIEALEGSSDDDK